MKIGRDEMRGRRNRQIEAELQRTLDEGGNVWAIGDVHGYADTLLALLDSLNLSSRDRVVLLGDLVDRGPRSCEVIRIARENPQIFSVLGNHEEMMLNSFEVDNIETMTAQQTNWFYVGGRATNQSYIDEFTNSQGDIDDFDLRMRVGKDLAWLDSLPHHIVLDDFRLVHAGYSPWDGDLDLQSTDTLMWVRGEFHNSITPVDEKRTVVFGHSTVLGFGLKQTEIWKSEAELQNSRPAAIGIDSCCYGGKDPQLTAFNLQTGDFVKQRVIPKHKEMKA
jgi:diadenosine tetraphosphatase ApaH/serine/threonine PP2A family protein phosphatase